jgi:hypothetical protein
LSLLARLRATLHADATRIRFRRQPQAFTRQRCLPFARLAVLVLRGHKVSQQNALNKVFRELDALPDLPTASAYSQARQKLDPQLFAALNAQLVADFYALSTEDGSLVRWWGHRLLGADGTRLNVPDTPALRSHFGVQGNQHETFPQATAVVLYDLGNDLGLAATFDCVSGEKTPLCSELWTHTQPNDVLVLDRNFADYEIIASAVQTGRHVVIRCPYQFNAVKAFWDSDATDAPVTLGVPDSPFLRPKVRAGTLPATLPVRLLKFTLPSGETEVLLTTLLDVAAYPHAAFYPLYARRWAQETYYDRLKNIFEVERWSGQSLLTLQQDFFGVVFLMTLESILAQDTQAVLTARDQRRQPKTPSQVNRAVSYVALVDHAVALLLDPRASPEQTLADLQQLFQTTPTRQRPGRHVPRPKRKPSKQVRYHKFRKRLSA